ncbi:SET domain-containing protein [Parathielavia hyrcaniae]|uniref:SET domain-containing protein n=1 Tax=Parathielavia hyrcaniae TaxID=113614 RepID=A0AAN6PWM9_9PEZI|nr:SET domain-containing protein [Parathielavia hyrcaniae]
MDIDSQHCRFAERTRNFVGWFRALPGATFRSDLIAVQDLRAQEAGRGIVALANIEPDTVLFTIPRNAIICAATSQLRDKIPQVFDLDHDGATHPDHGDDDDGGGSSTEQSSWTLLILVMIYEYLQVDSSRWRPYLDVLPTAFDTPMFWSPNELAELQASALVAKVGKQEADRMIQDKIIPVIRAHEHVFFPLGSSSSSQILDDNQLLSLAHRIGSTIMAYAFDLESDDNGNKQPEQDEDDEWMEDREGKTMLGMVPMADILNADAEFNAHINHGEDALTATALRPIRAGEEILNYYGPLPSGELMRRYGYVTPKHNRYNVVELPWELVETELRQRAGGFVASADWEKARNLTQADDEFEESFVLERASDDPDSEGKLLTSAVFTGLPDELGEQFKAFLKAVKKVSNADLAVQALSDRDLRKGLYLEAVLGALQARERQYATSLEEDEQVGIRTGQLTRRQEMAVCVRRGEKEVLREAQSWIRRHMDETRNDLKRTQGNDGPGAKRQRV